jgi:hypothetical protein
MLLPERKVASSQFHSHHQEPAVPENYMIVNPVVTGEISKPTPEAICRVNVGQG